MSLAETLRTQPGCPLLVSRPPKPRDLTLSRGALATSSGGKRISHGGKAQQRLTLVSPRGRCREQLTQDRAATRAGE